MSQDRPAAGLFADRGQAARAVDDLRRAGFDEQVTGFAMQQSTGMGPAHDGGSTDEPPGPAVERHGIADRSGTGAVLGGLLGEAAAGLARGVGPIFAGGTLSGLISGSPTATAGIAGALVESGLTQDEAERLEGAIEHGRILVIVNAGRLFDRAAAILEAAGGSRFGINAERESSPNEETRD